MADWDAIIERLREWIEIDETTVADRESGLMKDFALKDGQRVDVTHETISKARERIERNKKLIAAAEAQRAHA